MIVVLVRVETTAEDVEAMRDVLCETEAATRAEAGCHDYSFCQELSDPGAVRVVELWESMEALAAHFATPHMKKFSEALASRPPRSMTVKMHELGAELAMPS